MVNLQPTVGPDGKIKEPESNVLLASIENMQYTVTVDVLHTVRITLYLVFIQNVLLPFLTYGTIDFFLNFYQQYLFTELIK